MATSCTLTLSLTAKTFTQSVDIAFRESVTVVISGAPAGTVAANLRLYVLSGDTLVASCLTFAADGSNFTGTLSLSTSALSTYFGNALANEKRTFDMQVWDAVEVSLLANYRLKIQNNPWSATMTAPTAIAAISFD